jgi:branched-chain amino acid transport system substrate-binding protein
VLYQNDDYGKDYLIGLREGLGDKANKMIVATQSYETTDATIDSQILSLRASGANLMFNVAIPKFAAQAIRKNWGQQCNNWFRPASRPCKTLRCQVSKCPSSS